MANIKPFKAIIPAEQYAGEIAALPYDVYNREEAKAEVMNRPNSFLNIDRAETHFSDQVNTYDDCVYEKANELLWKMVEEGKFTREKQECYYIYQLIMDGRKQTGIVACADVDDYVNQTIKKHENTREDKELDRIRHVDTTNAQTGPIFLAYRSNVELNEIIEEQLRKTPIFHIVSEDLVTHNVWKISDFEVVSQIEDIFANIHEVYIADGHHRCASAVKVALNRRSKFPKDSKSEEYNKFLSVLFPDDELKILDYNRVVKDLNGFTTLEFILELEKYFNIGKAPVSPYAPNEKGEFGMYLEGCWYRMKIKPEFISSDAVEGLDVAILQNHVLDNILGIKDPKTDRRIDFVGGIRGLKELEDRVKSGWACAFSMYPTSMKELFQVADENRLMPPKSTWFEPKLRSGLFIHDITRVGEQ